MLAVGEGWNTSSAAKIVRTPSSTVPTSSLITELSSWKVVSVAGPLPKSHWKQTVPGGTILNWKASPLAIVTVSEHSCWQETP